MVTAAPEGSCAAICDGESERVLPLDRTTCTPDFHTLNELQLFHHLVDGLHFWLASRGGLAQTPDRFINLEIHARISFHTDNTKQDTECLGSLSALPDDLSHVIRVDRERKENAHLIDSARRFDRLGVINKCLHCVFEECLVWFHRGI